jgi:hypothetical protein
MCDFHTVSSKEEQVPVLRSDSERMAFKRLRSHRVVVVLVVGWFPTTRNKVTTSAVLATSSAFLSGSFRFWQSAIRHSRRACATEVHRWLYSAPLTTIASSRPCLLNLLRFTS